MTNAELARRCACSFMAAESAEREIAAAARYRRLAARSWVPGL